MTEEEWLECGDPEPMLDYLRDKASVRKLRLFACACCRLIWDDLNQDQCRNGIEVAERFADGQATMKERIKSLNAVHLIKERESVWQEGDDPDDIDEGAYAVEFALSDGSAIEIAGGAADQSYIAGDFERVVQGELLRDIFGNPFRPLTVDPTWLTSTVISLAQVIYNKRTFDRLPILADALEDAGCTNEEILNHCRQPGEHVRGCWVVDLVLSKE